MKKICLLILLIVLVLFTGCKNAKGQTFGEYLDSEFPKIVYFHDTWRFHNRGIPIPDGYILNQGNSYEWVATEDGYVLIVHFVKGGAE